MPSASFGKCAARARVVGDPTIVFEAEDRVSDGFDEVGLQGLVEKKQGKQEFGGDGRRRAYPAPKSTANPSTAGAPIQ